MDSRTEPKISADVSDMSREIKAYSCWCPSRSLLASIRAYQHYANSRNPFLVIARKVAVLRHRFWSIVTGADIPVNCHIGGGLLLPHPSGVVIHPDARIGPNCLIFSGAVIGTRRRHCESLEEGPPIIGGHVEVGANATILGAVRIGDHALIGAGAVVLIDVPEARSAVGVPAAIVHWPTEGHIGVALARRN